MRTDEQAPDLQAEARAIVNDLTEEARFFGNLSYVIAGLPGDERGLLRRVVRLARERRAARQRLWTNDQA